jgi:ABC-2 type transport system ATP-binding protein
VRGVQSVVVRDTQFTVRGVGNDLVTDVIECISDHRMRVSEFRTELPNLEDVFLKLTGHSIKD